MKLIRYQTSPRYIPASHPSLLAEMDRLFDAAFPVFGSSHRDADLVSPFPIDLYQNKDAFTLRAELPGFRREDIGIELADGNLTISAQRQFEAGTTEEAKPATANSTSRTVTLPDNVNVEKIDARYELGVLEVTLPKQAVVKPRQIAIEVK